MRLYGIFFTCRDPISRVFCGDGRGDFFVFGLVVVCLG